MANIEKLSPILVLLDRVIARGGDEDLLRGERAKLCGALIEHLDRQKKAGGRDLISATSVKKWFDFLHGPSQPQRGKALRFLGDFYLTSEKSKSASAADIGELESFLRSAAPSARPSRPPPRRIKPATEEAKVQIQTLVGAYQLVRPHSLDANRLILEPLAIEAGSGDVAGFLRMYSHNQMRTTAVYWGDLHVSRRYCFCLAGREHEDNPNRTAFRSIVLNVQQRPQANTFEPRPCISGIMTRGVSGDSGGRRAVAVPFVLIKIGQDTSKFDAPDFNPFAGSLCRMARDEDLLIGHIEASDNLFPFCRSIFDNLREELFVGTALHSIGPEPLAAAIRRDPKSKIPLDDMWRREVRRSEAEDRSAEDRQAED